METQENSGIAPIGHSENNKRNTNEPKKRKHKKYIPSINRTALSELEGTTTSSFLDLAKAVVLIDNAPYDEDILPMSKSRKIDFERLIAHYAQLEIYGKRKYHIKSVFSRMQKEIPNDIELRIEKKAAYTKAKPLTEAQKQARRLLYKAKKEKAQQDKEYAIQEEMKKTQEKIANMNNTAYIDS